MSNHGLVATRAVFSSLAFLSTMFAIGVIVFGWVWVLKNTFGLEVVSWTWAILGLPVIFSGAFVMFVVSICFRGAAHAIESHRRRVILNRKRRAART